jgi:hypothetical protein
MSEAFKYRFEDPDSGGIEDYFSRDAIWVGAVKEFLWSGKPNLEVVRHPAFGWWCEWRGRAMGIYNRPGILLPLTDFIAGQEKENRYAVPGLVVVGEVQKLWEERWEKMPMLEGGRLKPRDKQPFWGMRFCLIVLCLQHGPLSGRGGRITWLEAKDSASLLLAATALINCKRVPSEILRVPWSEIVEKSIKQREKISNGDVAGDLGDYPDDLPKSEGMEGLRYRLAVTLGKSWPELRSLAAAYSSHGESRALNDWMKRARLDLWFSLKAP